MFLVFKKSLYLTVFTLTFRNQSPTALSHGSEEATQKIKMITCSIPVQIPTLKYFSIMLPKKKINLQDLFKIILKSSCIFYSHCQGLGYENCTQYLKRRILYVII